PEQREGSRCLPAAVITIVQARTQIPRVARDDKNFVVYSINQNALMLWFLFAWCLRLARRGLQPLEFLHFMLRHGRLTLFAVKVCQPEMRLRRERAFFFYRKKFRPFFFGSRCVALE